MTTENSWLSELKVGDFVLVENSYNDVYSKEEVKSVSVKRGDITLTSGMRFDSCGREKKAGHYSRKLVEYTPENMEKSNAAKKRITHLKMVKGFDFSKLSNEKLAEIVDFLKGE